MQVCFGTDEIVEEQPVAWELVVWKGKQQPVVGCEMDGSQCDHLLFAYLAVDEREKGPWRLATLTSSEFGPVDQMLNASMRDLGVVAIASSATNAMQCGGSVVMVDRWSLNI